MDTDFIHIFASTKTEPNYAADDSDNVLIAGDLEVQNETYSGKCKLTAIGGYAVLLTNKSLSNSVAGDIVETHATVADAVDVADGSATDAIGIFLDSGVADGGEAWVVVAGIADVHMDADGCAVHNRIITSVTPGRGDVSNTPAVGVHFQEIGHAIEVAAANANARCVIHFL